MPQVVATNLFTNPSYETAGAVEVVRTNLATNPSFEAGTSGWGGSSGATGTVSTDWAYSGASSVKIVGTTASTTAGSWRFSGSSATVFPLGMLAGRTYRISVRAHYTGVHSSFSTATTSSQRRIVTYISTDGSTFTNNFGPQAPNEAGDFTLTHTVTIPSNATGAIIGIGTAMGNATDVTNAYPQYFDDFTVEDVTDGVPVDATPFSGATAASNDRTYAWTGTANASTSTQSVTRVAGVTGGLRSTQWASQGTHSLRVESGTATVSISSSSTVIVTARNAGQTINGVAGVAGVNRVTGATSLSLGAGYWDQLAIVAGNYTGDYFDGSTTGDSDTSYAWTGAPNASTSTKSVLTASDYQLPAGESVWSVGRRYLWFGNGHEQKWLPMPSSGIQVNSSFAVSGGTLANGGQYVRRSRGYSRSFEFNFEIRDASGYNGLEQYGRFASDAYGLDVYDRAPEDELFYFCDPMVMKRNVLPPQWATPGLCRYSTDGRGFHDIAPARMSDVPVATPSNTRGLPDGTINWNVAPANTGSTLPDDLARHTARVLIPPTHRLYLGFTGSMTGSAAIMVRQHLRAGGYTDSTITTLIDPSSANGLGSLAVDGQTVAYVTIWLGRLAGTEGTIQLYGAMGQLWPRWETPDMTTGGKFTEGLGHGGLEFSDEAIVEQYVVADQGGANGALRYLKGMNTTLSEVGPWR